MQNLTKKILQNKKREQKMKNELNIKIDGYTDFYLKIERKYSDRQDEYDKWCIISRLFCYMFK